MTYRSMMTTAAETNQRRELPPEQVIAILRERLYGAISCLATLAVLARYTTDDTDPWGRVLDVAVATGGLWAASLLADWLAHLSVHGKAPRGKQFLAMLQSSSQILQASGIPLLLLLAAGIGWLNTYTAMWAAMWILVGELGLIALLAVRRTELPWWQKALLTLALAAVGALVIGVKIVAH